jgi:hypothetical protein
VRSAGRRDVGALNTLAAPLTVLNRRRLPALEVLVLAWGTLLLALATLRGWRRGRGPALRWGGLAVLWCPATVLVAAAVAPAHTWLECLIVVGGALALAAGSDALVRWPRGTVLPAAIGLAAITVDVARGSPLLVRSLLGPNPSFGSRFYGIGNELKSGLTVLMLVGVAAAVGPRRRSRRLAALTAACGVALGVVIGSGRLGAGVGGVIIVAVATAVATLLMLPGGPSRRAVVLAIASPAAALAALIVLDLATAGGRGHLVHDVLHARGARNLEDIVVRRYSLALGALLRGAMPLVTVVAGLAVAFAWRNRWLWDPIPHPIWRAALAGGLAGGVAGSLTEDSGPLLFVVAVFALAAVTAYVRGGPDLTPPAPAGNGSVAKTRESELSTVLSE